MMEANDMAAMREAQAAINCIDTRGLKYLLCQLVEADIFDGGQINKTISAVDKAKAAIDAALAEPPRNCDRFADETDAQIEFLNEVWLISVTKETALERDRFENWTDEMKSAYAKWLLAPAKGQKGENDGSK